MIRVLLTVNTSNTIIMPKYQRPRSYKRPMKKSMKAKASDAHIRKIAKAAIVQQVEHKLVPYNLTTVAVPATGYILGLTDVVQSTTQSTDTSRIGDQIRPLRLQVNLVFSNSSTTIPDKVRCMMIKWHEGYTLNPPTFAKVMLGTPYLLAQTTVDLGPDRARQFTVLHDAWIDVPAFTATSRLRYATHKIDIKCTGSINYVAASTTNCSGGYYLMMASYNSNTDVEAYSTFRFMDA